MVISLGIYPIFRQTHVVQKSQFCSFTNCNTFTLLPRPYLDSCGTWNGARLVLGPCSVAGDSMDWFQGTFTGKPQKIMAGWWFGTFGLCFHIIGNNNPIWRTHIFQRGGYTTNQMGKSMVSGEDFPQQTNPLTYSEKWCAILTGRFYMLTSSYIYHVLFIEIANIVKMALRAQEDSFLI